MKVLVTGFEPFGGEKMNPALEAVKLLPGEIAGAEIIKLEVPVVFSRSTTVIEKAINQYKPDIIISVGQAGGYSHIAVERVAVNIAQASIPDNDGEQPNGTPLREDGEMAYNATVPVDAMIQNVIDHKIPCRVSFSAGTYVCNALMYNVLYILNKQYPKSRAGFIHVPFSTEQVENRPGKVPSMPLDTITNAIKYCIEAAVLNN
ncbi:pyroglutamyl-peptidase I [Histomonas meleagridis]|uniref:pyroglutamyl-peptidase I n=1 Tax=Histomonas meleagridis TaxID=135588 RepID=UPI0035594070|nr:pyroglutamyl-peptidase I [Histomonas meleagridis]KAH0798271.1 pyroglutamyl-peptidase I [Histomonas meleagridis]